MINAKLSFFWTLNSVDHGSHGNKGIILLLRSVNIPMSDVFTNFI